MRFALGTDHAGYAYKEILKAHLLEAGHDVHDFGTDSETSVDYPDYVGPAAEAVAQGLVDLGIVLGGSGNGEAIVANKAPGVRCGLCWNVESARLTKLHNNANVISIGARMVPEGDLIPLLEMWLQTTYEGGRHDERIRKIHAREAQD